jgi:hypothetical protein
MTEIKKMKFWCQKVLPLVYDNSLSYYEVLCKFLEKLNEVIELYNNITDDFESLVDKKIAEFKIYVDEQNNIQDDNLNAYKDEVSKNFDDVYDKISLEVNRLYAYINNLDNTLRIWVTGEINALKKYIDDAILGKIMIYDPTIGYKNPLDVVINHVYDALRYYGITCYQFDAAKWTAQRYDNTHITALKFDTLSKQIIGKIYEWYVFDYVTGTYDTVQRVLYRLFQTVRPNAITTNTFDTRANTADEFDVLRVTAFNFDDDGVNQIPS